MTRPCDTHSALHSISLQAPLVGFYVVLIGWGNSSDSSPVALLPSSLFVRITDTSVEDICGKSVLIVYLQDYRLPYFWHTWLSNIHSPVFIYDGRGHGQMLGARPGQYSRQGSSHSL